MKQVLLATALTIACAASFAQKAPTVGQDGPGAAPISDAASQKKVEARDAATPNPVTRQPTQVGQDGPKNVPSDAASQSKIDARNASNPNPTTQFSTPIGQDGPGAMANEAAFQKRVTDRNAMMYKAMDVNGDGRVSRAEWNTYHSKNWSGLKQSNGAVSREEMDMMMKRSY
jgi:hypothetical protein